MDRRKFLQGAAALFAAPAIVKAENIMRIALPKEPEIWVMDNLKIMEVPKLDEGFEVFEFDRTEDARKYELVLRVKDGPNSLNYLGENMGRGPQILKKQILITGCQAVSTPQNAELKYQIAKKSRECVMDLLYQEHMAGKVSEFAWRDKRLVNEMVGRYWGVPDGRP